MKKTFKITALTLFAIIAFAGLSYAGVIGGIVDKFTGVALETVVGYGVAGVLSLLSIFLGKKILAYKNILQGTADVFIAIIKAVDEGSPGGKNITSKELQKIIEETGEVGVDIAKLIQARRADK